MCSTEELLWSLNFMEDYMLLSPFLSASNTEPCYTATLKQLVNEVSLLLIQNRHQQYSHVATFFHVLNTT